MTARYLEDFAVGQTFSSRRLRIDAEQIKTFAAAFDECRWPRPVRPGDALRVASAGLEVRPSQSRPDQGLIKVRTTLNQHGEAVLVLIGNLVVRRRVQQGA